MTKSVLSPVLFALAMVAAAPLVTQGEAQAAFTQQVAVPAYFYPGPIWNQLEDGVPTVGFAVMDPASGPGLTQDPFYVTQIAATQAAGIRILGYVDTAYGARSLAAVQADVDLYYLWYGVDGIFFDQASNNCLDEPYYQTLSAYVHGKDAAATTVINPGTNTPECFIAAADVLLNFENTYAVYAGWSPSGWEAAYPPSRFWHLVHTTDEADMPSALALSQQRNAGWVYVTSDIMPNPWDVLPSASYWARELATVRPSNSCASAVARPRLAVSGLATPDADDALTVSGQALLAGAPPIDPSVTGVRLLLDDGDAVVSDVTIPGGAYADPPGLGWKTAGNTWKYLDRSGVGPGGVTKVVIKDLSSQAPGSIKFTIKARNASYPVSPASLALRAALLLDGTSPDGPCALEDFTGTDPVCTLSRSGAALKCR